MARGVSISPDVKAVLERATVEANRIVRLPEGQLDRALYTAVDKVLKALGGKWNSRVRGHVFADGIGGELADALGAGFAVDQKRTAEQFFTPPHVAAKVFERALISEDMHVLEPSAGNGRLIWPILDLGALVTAVEQDEDLCAGLVREATERYRHGDLFVFRNDFISWAPAGSHPIDRVVMNPPFSRGQDMAHVKRAFGFLRPGGILVAVMSPHWTFGTDRQSDEFRRFVFSRTHHWDPLPDGSFKSSGTDVRTGILSLRKAEA